MIETNAQIYLSRLRLLLNALTFVSDWFSDKSKSFNLKETAFYFY